jgi:hypothetical protein
MMIDMVGFEMMLLMNMPVEPTLWDVAKVSLPPACRRQSTNPTGMEFEQRTVRQATTL